VEYSERDYYESGTYLFRTVIARAVQEASGSHLVLLTNEEGSDEVQNRGRVKEEARRWLVTDSWQLRLVFHLAQTDREYREFLKIQRRRFGYGLRGLGASDVGGSGEGHGGEGVEDDG
jgi:hypothetical protein